MIKNFDKAFHSIIKGYCGQSNSSPYSLSTMVLVFWANFPYILVNRLISILSIAVYQLGSAMALSANKIQTYLTFQEV